MNTVPKARGFTVTLDQKFLKMVHTRRLQVDLRSEGGSVEFEGACLVKFLASAMALCQQSLTLKLHRIIVHYIKLSHTKFQAICMPKR